MSTSGVTDLVKRILFVLAALIVYRIGSHVPVPGVDPSKIAAMIGGNDNMFGLLNMFSGGAFARLSIFAIGIMPYISASIIIQLLSAVSPALEQLKKEGQSGKRKLTQYTRYLTVALATVQSFGMAKFMAASGVAIDNSVLYLPTVVITLVTGTMFLMWLGEQMTERGVGNGISLLIFAGIVAALPTSLANTVEQVRQGEMQLIGLILLCIMIVGVIAFVVFFERAQRRITINYARRQEGRKMYAAQKSHLPLKINMAGVIPPIFASALLFFPATISPWVADNPQLAWLGDIALALSPSQPLYLVLFAAAIIFFCFFYTALVFNPKDTADNLKRSGGFIPGIRPGPQTSAYIDKIMGRLTFIGAGYITLVSLLPEFLRFAWNVPFYFGGTSLLIIVVVVMDFMAQVQTHLMSGQYESLMKKANLKGMI